MEWKPNLKFILNSQNFCNLAALLFLDTKIIKIDFFCFQLGRFPYLGKSRKIKCAYKATNSQDSEHEQEKKKTRKKNNHHANSRAMVMDVGNRRV